MCSFTNRTLILVCNLMLFAGILTSASVKELRSPVQTGDKIIIAKGDIPTPEKYHPAIEAYLAFILAKSNDMIFKLDILEKN